MSSIFQTLTTTYTTWPALKAFLTSAEGGNLRVDDHSKPGSPYALIRYVKGKSDMRILHTRVFRSVVWDTLEHRPVSVTPPKSAEGESLPPAGTDYTQLTAEHFVDGIMIGVFFDKYSNQWRIHTRSTLDGASRYYSQTKSFTQLFAEAGGWRHPFESQGANKSYTFVLQHSENRIVVPVVMPKVTLVQVTTFVGETVTTDTTATSIAISGITSESALRARIDDWNVRFRHTVQGIVLKDAAGNRWKIRTPEYNRVRMLRGNSARRDYLWLSMWRAGNLSEYLGLFPEERASATATIERWKRATGDVYHYYCDVFKARTLEKVNIPPKYRPLVYALHSMYLDTLKPAKQTVDWKTTLQYMNNCDVAQMLFVINWELRQAAKAIGAPSIPFEPAAARQGTEGEEVSAAAHTHGATDTVTRSPSEMWVDLTATGRL